MLPGANRAVIDPAKVRDYLLSTVHPVGRFKAVVFQTLGYTTEAWEQLSDDLLALALSGTTVLGKTTPFGQKYEVSGTLRGPNGREAQFVSIWLLPPNDEAPRFITAFPS